LAVNETITVDFPLLYSPATHGGIGMDFPAAAGKSRSMLSEAGFRVFLWHSAASGPSFFLWFVLALSGGTSFPGRR
jgi:hypothetical protein